MILSEDPFPQAENFPKIPLLKVENFQLFSDGRFVSANYILQNVLSAENFPEWKWASIFTVCLFSSAAGFRDDVFSCIPPSAFDRLHKRHVGNPA
jgi:hypothetical protein